jgi:hypothetical protein
MQSSSESPFARKFVAAVFRVWWKTKPPALRPTGSPAALHASAHERRKSPTQP